jgi:hypothetical protein
MFETVVCRTIYEFLEFVKLQVEKKSSMCSDYKIPRFCAEFSMEEEHLKLARGACFILPKKRA